MFRHFILLFFIITCLNIEAATYHVGSTRTYLSPNALYQANVVQDGDTIEIDGETYTGNATLAVWQGDNIVIRGVNGRPHLFADGKYIQGKGIWVLAGDNITVDNIEFSGATVPDENGAGIRLDGIGLNVRHCYFHNNENGILTSNPFAGDILIEYTEFGYNGFGDGFSHNLYIGHVNKLTFRFNYSHHANVGHNLKSRANENYIYYNRIMDEETGNSSRLIDLSNGGFSIIMGNLLMQGPNAENNNLIGYGREGLSNTPAEVYIVNNTMVNKRTASCIFVDLQNGTTVAQIFNNIFTGTGTPVNGTATALAGNIIDPVISNMQFEDEANYDYHLKDFSPAMDQGVIVDDVNGYSLIPDSSYLHPLIGESRIIINAIIDPGAYEFYFSTAVHDQYDRSISIYPVPTTDVLNIDGDESEIAHLKIYSIDGEQLISTSRKSTIDLSGLSPGIYVLNVLFNDRTSMRRKVIKY